MDNPNCSSFNKFENLSSYKQIRHLLLQINFFFQMIPNWYICLYKLLLPLLSKKVINEITKIDKITANSMVIESEYLIFFFRQQPHKIQAFNLPLLLSHFIFYFFQKPVYPTFSGWYWCCMLNDTTIEQMVRIISIQNIVDVNVKCSPLYICESGITEYCFYDMYTNNRLIVTFFPHNQYQKLIFEI